tara:strand:+ start:196 stop:468 length:273 start_codon:yes stop_codon:yes gene_type:complete
MVQFEYDEEARRYNVIAPFTLFGESDMITVASISEDADSRITLYRDIEIKLMKQIIMHWDEYVFQIKRNTEREELNNLLKDNPKNKKKGK